MWLMIFFLDVRVGLKASFRHKLLSKRGWQNDVLVIGAETLSRVVDPHDRDSMIYSDGAGATIIESAEEDGGILSHESASYTHDEVYHLFFGCSNNKSLEEGYPFHKNVRS